jgi:hypothetical protein
MSKPRSGGGPAMNKNVKVGVKSGGPSRATSPGAADQIGASTAFKKEEVDGAGRGNRSPVPLGNAVALNVGAGGPGKRRDIHPCGSQSLHGPVNRGESRGPARDILSEFGSERSKG